MEPRGSVAWTKSTWWPAPVAIISVGTSKPNMFPLGVLGGPTTNPPTVTISPRPRMYSYPLMIEAGQFVVNFPTAHQLREMEYAGTHSAIEADKWKVNGFTPAKSTVVDVPGIAECPVRFECTIEKTMRFMRDDGKPGAEQELMIGRIVCVNFHEEYFIGGQIQWDMIDLIFRHRPRTWRTLGPVLGYDTNKPAPADPEAAADLTNRRIAGLAGLFEAIRSTPYPTQVTNTSL